MGRVVDGRKGQGRALLAPPHGLAHILLVLAVRDSAGHVPPDALVASGAGERGSVLLRQRVEADALSHQRLRTVLEEHAAQAVLIIHRAFRLSFPPAAAPGVLRHPMTDLISTTEHGLYCALGDFYIDPWKPVERAVVTHAHADHARPGSTSYLTTTVGAPLLERRVQAGAKIDSLPYGEAVRMGEVSVSLHPAGHVLGSAQVRLEHAEHGVWVIGGDYKTAPDPTCATFEPVACDVFVSESTFGLPVFVWQGEDDLVRDILAWWAANQAVGKTSMLYAYALGKAQRLLAGIGAGALGPIAVHGAVHKLNGAYAEAGVELPAAVYASPEAAKEIKGSGLVVAPPSASGTPWTRKFGPQSSGFASGWMRMRGPRRRRGFDHGFVMSDHADWAGLLMAIEACGAQRVLVTHGYIDPLVRYLKEERGLDAQPLATAFGGDPSGEEPSGGAEDAP